MFEIADLRLVRGAFSALSLAVLLGACAHTAPPEPAGPKSWIVENVSGKTTQELYADWIAPAVYERSGSKVIGDYTVESGNLIMPDKSIGSLVTVRSKDGSLTTVVEQKGKSGLLAINNKGQGNFTPYLSEDFARPDTVSVEEVKESANSKLATEEPLVVDIFMGYSRSAVEAAGGDVVANALAKVESVNLALRNSLVTSVSLRLVGVQVVEQSYPVTGETLSNLPTIFKDGIQRSQPDLIHGMFTSHPDDTAGGWGEYRGRKAISHVIGEAFRHEVGHNAGGAHCYSDGGAISTYAYGYNNGKTHTIQCGNGNPYYSNPLVKDGDGLPIGHVLTANMARVWRNNEKRLSSYAPPTELSAPGNFGVVWTSHDSIKFEWDKSPRAVKYEVWGRDNILLPPKRFAESTTLDAVVTGLPSGLRPYHVVAVYFDGSKSSPSNIVSAKPYGTSARNIQ
jgi:hypothetical protein